MINLVELLFFSDEKTFIRDETHPIATSFGSKSTASEKPSSDAIQFLCDSITPFGVPVDPDVYMMMAMSSGDGGDAIAELFLPVLTTSLNDKI